MTAEKLFPANNIAFYDDDYVGDALLGLSSRHRRLKEAESVDIFDYGPWQYPAESTHISARYIIGQSRAGYHWCTEFIVVEDPKRVTKPTNPTTHSLSDNNFNWSPPSKSVNDAIKRARRCVAIQAKNIDLDTKTKIKLRLKNGEEKLFDIDQIPLDHNLIYQIGRDDLHRVALFNGYLSWHEFERGILDFSLA